MDSQDPEFKERFLQSWAKYFPGAELPIGFHARPANC